MSKENKARITQLLGVEPVELNAVDFTGQSRRRLFWCNFPVPPVHSRAGNALMLELGITKKSWQDALVPESEAAAREFSDKFYEYLHRPIGDQPRWLVLTEKSLYFDTAKPKSPCLLASNAHVVVERPGPWFRKLDPVEAERLQGFPEDWTNAIKSEKKRFALLGNAVAVPVAQFLFGALRQRRRCEESRDA